MIRVVKKHIGFHYLLIEIVVYFDFFGIEYIPQKLLNKIRDKSITGNIFIMQDHKSIMCGFYCIPFIEYDYTNSFSPNDYKKNDKIMYKYFKDKYGRRNKSHFRLKN